MSRNLNKRVEIACPILDTDICLMLQKILDIELKDNQKASFLQPDGSYCRKKIDTEEPFNSQEYFMEHSLHKPEISMHNKPNLFKEMISRLNKWLENK